MANVEIVGLDDDRAMDLNSRAAEWHTRLRAPDVAPAEREAFERWLEASPEHAKAYATVSRAATLASAGLAADPRFQALMEAELGERSGSSKQGVSQWQGAGIAAAVAAVAVLGVFAANRSGPSDPRSVPQVYANDELQQRIVTLADGSTVHLDAASEIAATLSSEGRELSLIRGRAFFEVAHDSARPFTVESAGVRTLATGTQFEVRMEPDQVRVTLAEGSVAVSTSSWHETLAPGEQLVVHSRNQQLEKRRVDAQRAVAWSRGRLNFDGTPLAQVLDEVNRYFTTRIVLGDEALGRIPIGGSFAAGGDARGFVDALAAILPVEGDAASGDRIVLYPRRSAPTQH